MSDFLMTSKNLLKQGFLILIRNLADCSSPEVILWILQKSNNIKTPLLVKKSDDKGKDHHFIGNLSYFEGSENEQKMTGNNKKSVVNLLYKIDDPEKIMIK